MTIHASTARPGLAALAALAAALLAAPPASAATVIYTLSGQLDGTIGSTALNDTAFTWTLKTNNLAATQLSGFPALPAFSADLKLGGIGDATFLTPTFVSQNPDASQFAVIDNPVTDGAGWTAPAFATDVLGAAFGAQAASYVGSIGALQTDLGTFQLGNASNLTFSAVVVPTPPVLVTLQGLVSGTLNGVAFTDDPFRWSLTADTSGPSSYFGLPALAPLGAGSLQLGGFGPLTTSDSFEFAENPDSQAAGFVNPTGTQGVVLNAPNFGTYVLGDVLSGLPVNFGASEPVQTSGGLLDFTSASLTLSVTPLAGAPEPSAWALSVLGFAALGGALRRRRALAAALAL